MRYQLGKIMYGVLNLTVSAVINPEQAQKTWDGYIEPMSNLIDALKNKQISLRDGIRAGTALAVSMKAQSMLAKGCEKLYSVAKIRALAYIAKNPSVSPEQYMATPEGACFGIISESTRKKKVRNIPEPSSKELLGKLSDDAVQKALDYANIENNFKHYFDEKHNLGGLIKLLGSKENVLRAVLKSAEEYLPASGVFVDIPIKVADSTVWIRGRIMDGVPKFSTIFIR